MTQKDFVYEGNIQVKLSSGSSDDLEVKDICFLTPARMTVTQNGVQRDIDVSVDIMNKIVYEPGKPGPSSLTKAFFKHLDTTLSLPEDMFRAGPEITEIAQQMQEEHEQILERAEWE